MSQIGFARVLINILITVDHWMSISGLNRGQALATRSNSIKHGSEMSASLLLTAIALGPRRGKNLYNSNVKLKILNPFGLIRKNPMIRHRIGVNFANHFFWHLNAGYLYPGADRFMTLCEQTLEVAA